MLICNREPMPGSWDTDLDSFQKMIVLKCLRTDKITEAMQDYVAANLGQRFIEPQVGKWKILFIEPYVGKGKILFM